MNHIMTKEESYAERRKLFKDIWDTSMIVNEKDDILSKPKIIKTLRLDEMDRTVAGKKKNQKIKNLRTVCNKLLDFCDRQDADDLFYEQMASQEKAQSKLLIETDIKKKKQIKLKRKIKIKKANSVFLPPDDVTLARAITSERKENFEKEKMASRYTSPPKFKRTNGFSTKKVSNSKLSPRITKTGNLSGDGIVQKKIVKKKRSKRKKLSKQLLPPGTIKDELKI